MSRKAFEILEDIILIEDKDLRCEKFVDWTENHLVEVGSDRRICEMDFKYHQCEREALIRINTELLIKNAVKEIFERDIVKIKGHNTSDGGVHLSLRLILLKEKTSFIAKIKED